MRTIKTNLERQLFNDGLIRVYTIQNIAEKGSKPKYEKILMCARVPYADKTAGEKRRFYAAYEGREFDRVIRVQREWGIKAGHIVELAGMLFKVISENSIFSVFPPFSELSLRKVENLDECVE